ncbi:hypothetical protein [Blautia sp. MSJ-19]|uniref:hypothetical protein n=1 Tax=Blautia sp. MSJ-19 TaxID=2841517 RepID=UPI001C0EB401|nr:hypothetical protein [Blautia sp. MSJ-19]MBU5481898.1 hypothetical protein [Blautia sp. MSJ-19]
MEQENISQTMLDQLVGSEQGQMLKALVPYLSMQGQQILAAYVKTQELRNTVQLFSRPRKEIQICSISPTDPAEMLENIKKFSYGRSRQRLDQITNALVMLQMLQTIHEENQEGI